MSEETPEVRVRLVIDDQSKETLEKLKQGLGESGDEAKNAEGAAKGLKEQAAAALGPYMAVAAAVGVVAVALGGAYELTVKLGEAALEAAANEYEQTRAMAGLFNMMDQGQHSFEQLQDYAADLHDDLEKVGMKAGVSADAITNAYNSIIERQQMGSDAARDLVENMAIVGKVTKGGIEGLGQGFSMIEMGMIRAKNPVVQLIAATHTLQGNARSVAKEMMKMSPEKQMEIATKAIEKQAELMKKSGMGAPTLGEVKTSLGGIRENVMEAMGKPILDAIIPKLAEVRDFLLSNLEAIKDYATKVGDEFGKGIEVMSDVFGGIYEAIKENWGDIVGATNSAAGPLLDAWHWIYEHKDELAGTFKHIASDMVAAFKWIVGAVHSVADEVMELLDKIPGIRESIRESKSDSAHVDASKAIYDVGSGPGGNDAFAKARADMVSLGIAAGESGDQLMQLASHLDVLHAQAEKAATDMDEDVAGGMFESWSAYMNKAMVEHREGSIQFAIQTLSNSTMMQQALVAGGIEVEGGFNSFLKMLDDKAPELAAKLKAMGVHLDHGVKPSGGPVTNFNGGQTFNIKQDFRDQDPDRIAVVFRRDILRAAESRRQSRVATPFGL